MKRLFIVLTAVLFLHGSLWAKEAAPMAKDPELEKQVNDVASELRCLVCQNQTIADSHAELAVDLKNQVRDMMAEGKTKKDVVDYMVQRYGDFVRYRPPVNASTALLWFGPFLLFVLGAYILFHNLRKRRREMPQVHLSEAEHQKAAQLLREAGEK